MKRRYYLCNLSYRLPLGSIFYMEKAGSFEYLGDGMMCYTHNFSQSKKNRRALLFLSRDKLVKGIYTARKVLDRNLPLLENVKKGDVRKSDYVRIHRVPWIDVNVSLSMQDRFIPQDGMGRARIVRGDMGFRCGFTNL